MTNAQSTSSYDVESIGIIPLSQLEGMGLTPEVRDFSEMDIGSTQLATISRALNGKHVNTQDNTSLVKRLD